MKTSGKYFSLVVGP